MCSLSTVCVRGVYAAHTVMMRVPEVWREYVLNVWIYGYLWIGALEMILQYKTINTLIYHIKGQAGSSRDLSTECGQCITRGSANRASLPLLEVKGLGTRDDELPASTIAIQVANVYLSLIQRLR